MVMFHGQQDNQISSFNSPRFYESLRAGMNYSVDQMDDFLRFFRISGMFHCQGGPGAWVLGQAGASAAQGPFDREHNVLAAVMDWVEQGVAPESMTGTKYVNDTVKSGVDFERTHCKWPTRNVYLGGGRDAKETSSWQCQPISQADEQVGAVGSGSAGNTAAVATIAAVSSGNRIKEAVPTILLALAASLTAVVGTHELIQLHL